MPLRLPPLPSLRLFEAAGRLQSFRLAAAELNLTPSAVSHGIVALEQTLGVTLFIRRPRGLLLTPEGADYLAYVSEALSLIAIGTGRLPSRHADRSIAVSCAPTLASRWLLPRLRGFNERWPQISLRIDTSQRQVGFPVDGFDFALRMSRAPAAGSAWTRLFGEQLIPVCSPAYRDRLIGTYGTIDLRQATLLHVTPASEDWQAWLDANHIDEVDAAPGLRFDTIQLAFEAATLDLGVALGRYPLVRPELAAGTLVELGPDRMAAETAYWLISSDGADHRPDLLHFKAWLLREAASCRSAA